MEQVTQGVQRMGFGDNKRGRGGGGGRGRGGTKSRKRDDEQEFDCIRTKPEHIQSKKGTSGLEVGLSTNFFGFQQKPDTRLFQYRVDFSLDEERTHMKKALVRQHNATLPQYMFDGSILLCFNRLYPEGGEPLVLFSRRENGAGGHDDCNITIKLVGEVHSTDHHYLQLLAIIQRQMMEKLGLELIGRNYYDPKAASLVREYCLEVWPGYITSIRQHENKILMCAEVSNKVIRTDTVFHQMGVIFQRRPPNYKGAVEKALIGSVVMTRYNKKTYRIDAIDWSLNPSCKFDCGGTQKSYQDYYQEKYNCAVTDPKQPLLVSKPKDRDRRGGMTGPILLVPELCFMTGLTDEQRSDFRLTSSLSQWTRMEPNKRVESLTQLSTRLTKVPSVVQELLSWNMKFSPKLLELKGRTLQPETINLRTKISYNSSNADWTRELTKGLFNPAHIVKWYMIYPDRDRDKTVNFLKCMRQVAPGLGVNLAEPRQISLKGVRSGDYLVQLDKLIPTGPEMIFCVVPSDKGDQYACIKRRCCIEQPVPSQVITVAKVLNKEKNFISMATKVVTQMACKMGAEPWALEIPFKGAMVVGYDTYHDSARRGESVGALVASVNDTFTRYFSTVDFHKDRTEMSNQIGFMFERALRKYMELKKSLPSRIFFYRDGVGEGQVSHVLEHEVMRLKDTARKIRSDYNPKVTFIIVSKRINTRFFTGSTPTKYGNPNSGTVVDDVVTLPERYDFFLISQSVRQGTVNPTSYNVIMDESGFSPDQLQRLSYKLTHLYYNWPGTVRVPAPCQYAHKLAFLTGTSLHEEPSEHLSDLLYFL